MRQRRRKCSGVPHTDYRRKSHHRRESLCVMIYVGDAELYNFYLQQTNPPTCLSSETTIHHSVILCVHEEKNGSVW